MIGWKPKTKLAVSTSTASTSLTPGTGKLTLFPPEAVYIEFSNVPHGTTDEIDADSIQLPADTLITIEVPTYKFKTLDKDIAGVSDDSFIYLQAKTLSGTGNMQIIEH